MKLLCYVMLLCCSTQLANNVGIIYLNGYIYILFSYRGAFLVEVIIILGNC